MTNRSRRLLPPPTPWPAATKTKPDRPRRRGRVRRSDVDGLPLVAERPDTAPERTARRQGARVPVDEVVDPGHDDATHALRFHPDEPLRRRSRQRERRPPGW